MKKAIVIGLLVLSLYAFADTTKKLWVSMQYEEHGDRVLFIQDVETGTRCYAITNDELNATGYAIACVPGVPGKKVVQ